MINLTFGEAVTLLCLLSLILVVLCFFYPDSSRR